MAFEQATVREDHPQEGERVPTQQDLASQQAPVGDGTIPEAGEKGRNVPTLQDMASEQVPVHNTTTPEARDKRKNDDDSFNTKVRETEAQVAAAIQKAFSHLENRWDHDESIEDQMRNTRAQLIGTFKGLSTAFHQAGLQIRARTKKTDSPEK